MDNLRYDRLCRTSKSEAWLVSQGEDPMARLEIHFTPPLVYGLLIVEKPLDEQEIPELIDEIDRSLLWSHGVAREDFVVTVYRGEQLGVFSDPEAAGPREEGEKGEG